MPDKETIIKSVQCPNCGKMVEWSKENPWRPFCCERCRIIDLGEWADEKHRIPDDKSPDFTEDDFG